MTTFPCQECDHPIDVSTAIVELVEPTESFPSIRIDLKFTCHGCDFLNYKFIDVEDLNVH